jgi:hypothetical protein
MPGLDRRALKPQMVDGRPRDGKFRPTLRPGLKFSDGRAPRSMGRFDEA